MQRNDDGYDPYAGYSTDPNTPDPPGTLQPNPSVDPNGPGSPMWNAVVQMFQSALGRLPENDDVVRQWIQGTGGDLGAIQQGIYGSPEGQAYGSRNAYKYDPGTNTDVPKDPTTTPPDSFSTPDAYAQWQKDHPTTTPTTTPTPTTTGGGGGGGGGTVATAGTGVNTLPSPFDTPFVAPARIPMPDAPVFTPPPERIAPPFQGLAPFVPTKWSDVAPAPFKAPTMADVLADPGYQLPLQQGLGAISNSRAAQGLWGTGATGKAFQDYAQNYANTFYGNIYDRSASTYNTNWDDIYKGFTADNTNASDAWTKAEGQLVDTYNTNYKTQYTDPYANEYTAALDAFKPKTLAYTTTAADVEHTNDVNWTNAYNLWDTTFNHKYQTGTFLRDTVSS